MDDKTVKITDFLTKLKERKPEMETFRLVSKEQLPASSKVAKRHSFHTLPAFARNSGDFDLDGTVLGRGGMGVVTESFQKSLHRHVAIKRNLETIDEEELYRFLVEAKTIGYLAHPNIITIHSAFQSDEGMLYLILEKIEGETWSSLLHRDQEELFPKDKTEYIDKHLDILEKVMDAISYAHSKGIAHLDLKPSNIMVGKFGEVYVLDWGTAIRTCEKGPRFLKTNEDIYAPVGSPNYIAPEQALVECEEIGTRTDIFQLGAILFEMMTFEPPFHKDNVYANLVQSSSEEPVRFPFHYFPEYEKVCKKAIQKAPHARYDRVNDFQAAIKKVKGEKVYRVLEEQFLLSYADLSDEIKKGEMQSESRIHQLVGECSFAIKQILTIKKEDIFQQYQQELFEMMMEWALSKEKFALFDYYYSQLEDSSMRGQILKERKEAEEKKSVSYINELKDFRERSSLRLQNRYWRWLFPSLGFTWLFGCLVLGYLHNFTSVSISYPVFLPISFGILFVSFGFIFVVRKKIISTTFNRIFMHTQFVVHFWANMFLVYANYHKIPLERAFGLLTVFYATLIFNQFHVFRRRFDALHIGFVLAGFTVCTMSSVFYNYSYFINGIFFGLVFYWSPVIFYDVHGRDLLDTKGESS